MLFFVVFKDTSTTEIYTYVHTLSLHYALPIYRLLPADIFAQLQRQPGGRGREAEAARRHVPGRSECGGAEDRRQRPIDLTRLREPAPGQGERPATPGGERDDALRLPAAWRSEENTAELKSLMRTLNAIICLTKKRKKTTTIL